jgi:hypothetical protein
LLIPRGRTKERKKKQTIKQRNTETKKKWMKRNVIKKRKG